MRNAIVLVVVLAIAPRGASADERAPGFIGERVVSLGDLDGDGKPEFAAVTSASQPTVLVVSTATGTELWRAGGRDAVAIPDQDDDGLPDVAIAVGGERDAAWVSISSGRTGACIRTLTPNTLTPKPDSHGLWFEHEGRYYTRSVARLGGVGADGKPGLLVIRVLPPTRRDQSTGAMQLPGWCDDVKVLVVSLDGKVLAHLRPEFLDANWSSLLAVPAGDADGDGREHVLIRVARRPGKRPIELVPVYPTDASDLQHAPDSPYFRYLAYSLEFPGDPDVMPDALAAVGDVNGDGLCDFLFADTRGRRGEHEDAGVVRVLSGKDGREIRSVRGAKERDRLGTSVAALPDVDGDAVPDFVAGAPFASAGKSKWSAGAVVAYSGRTAKVLWTAKGDTAGALLGTAVAALPDVDGDGTTDLVVGAPGRMMDLIPHVLVLSGKTGKVLLSYPK